MARRQIETQSHAGTKFMFVLALILLALWAGHDPAGALAVLHAFGNALSSLASHAKETKK